jgi:YVTN family beta-propeller protein
LPTLPGASGPGQEYPSSIIFDSKNGNAYATDQTNDTVNIISGQNDTLVGTVNLDDNSHNIFRVPNDIAFDPKSGHIYVSAQTFLYNPATNITTDCANSSDLKCSVYEVNYKNHTIMNAIPVNHEVPGEIAFGLKNANLYILQYTPPGASSALKQNISVIDAKSNKLISTLNVGFGIKGLKIAFNPSNGNGYVTNDGFGYRNGSKGTVSVIDAKNNTITKKMSVGVLPYAISFNPNNGKAYIANQDSRTVSVIDSKDRVSTIPVDGGPTDIIFNPNDSKMYLALGEPNSIKTINAKNTFSDSYRLKGIPNNIVVNPKNGDIYASSSYPDMILLIHTHDKKIESIPLKMQTYRVDFNPVNEKAYVTNMINNTIAVIDTKRR